MTKQLRVLHCFEDYLPTTENWLFQMIDNVPNTEIIVASKNFWRCNFYPGKFQYVEFPIKKIDINKTSLAVRLVNRAVKWMASLYPWYLLKMCPPVDAVHAHFAMMGWDVLWLAKRLRRPLIVSFYGYDYESMPFREPVWEKRYAILFKEAHAFVCEGAYGGKILEKKGCPPSKIRVVPLGVKVEDIEYVPRPKKRGELKLLQIATFKPKKGHTYTVEAFARALEACPNMTLTLVGQDYREAPVRQRLRRKLAGTPAENKVTFLPLIDFDHLHRFMADYQVFIHPSHYTEDMDCEGGAPVVLLDAQASGMPAISTLHCDIPHVVIDGSTGLLAPEKDGDKLAGAIRRFYDMNQEAYNSFSVKARKHVVEHYDVARNARTLRDLYGRVVRENHAVSHENSPH